MTPTEAIPGHITGTTDNVTGVVHDAHTGVLTHIILATTPHTTDHLHMCNLMICLHKIFMLHIRPIGPTMYVNYALYHF